MVLKTQARELNEFGYQTTVVLPADKMIETSMTDYGFDVIVSDGLTQFYSLVKNLVPPLVSNGFSGNARFATSVQVIDRLCPYLAHDSVLMDTLYKRKFDAAIIDTPLVNLCTSVSRISYLYLSFSMGEVLNFMKCGHWYVRVCTLQIGC